MAEPVGNPFSTGARILMPAGGAGAIPATVSPLQGLLGGYTAVDGVDSGGWAAGVSTWNPGGFFTSPTFAAFNPEQATAPARNVLTTFIPGVGFAGINQPGAGLLGNVGTLGNVPILGLVGVLAILWLFERVRIRRRR